MGKFEAKEEKNKKFPVGILIAAVLVIVLALLPQLMNRAEEAPETQPAGTTAAPAATETEVQTQAPSQETVSGNRVSFPVSLEDGKLELKMLFQYSGINPDSANQEGTNIASIQLTNVSGGYLAQAKLDLTLQDGTVLQFAVTDLPAGGSVMAFCVDNLSVDADAAVAEVACEAEFAEPDASANGKLVTSAEGVTVKVTNISGEDLSNIVVYCRSVFGEDYFGGVTYPYTIENLPAGESATVEAWDCILGMAEVVRVAISES